MKVRFAVAPGGGAQEGMQIDAFADALETSGFDGVWLSDVPLAPMLDPLLGLTLIAGRTSRLRLGANVVPLGRNPFLLAKELAQLDRLCDGRLLLSFVPGLDHPGEREVLGVDGAVRGAVLEETLGLVRRWWAGEAVEHHSKRWSFPAIAAVARPVQEPLEVWLGGRGPKALERVGRIADGWLGAAITPDEARAACARIQRSAANAAREFDPEHFGLSIPYTRTAPDPALLSGLRARRPDIDPLTLLPVGARALRELIQQYIDAGLSKFVVRPSGVVAMLDLQS
jgi:probable F420-dependent oxidoreductase